MISIRTGRLGRLRRLAAIIGFTSLASVAVALGIVALQLGRGWIPFDEAQTLLDVVILAVSFPILGWVILRRQPTNPVGWVYLAVGFWQALNLFSGRYSTLAFETSAGNLPLAPELSWIALWAWTPGFTLFCTLGVLLFPDGRLPSRRWWPVAAGALIALALLAVPTAIASWPYRGVTLEAAALQSQPDFPAGSGLDMAFAIAFVGQIALLFAMIGAVAGLAVRFRRSRGVERQQLKWFTFGAVVDVALLVVWTAGVLDPLTSLFSALVFAPALPIAIGIAILRYRLYEIDRIISRTLAYAVLTAFLAIVYAVGFLGLQAILAPFTSGDGPVAVAASTLAVFALFSPVRRRIQGVVDRRFNRRRYDAAREVDAFATIIRDEVDFELLTVALAATLERTLQPASAAIWLRAGGSAGGGRS